MKLLWLDDVRDPHEDDWVVFCPFPKDQISEIDWVKNYSEFCRNIEVYGLPDGICFDHDLGFTNEYYIENNIPSPIPDKTGLDCAKWLVEYCINNNKKLPLYNIQSANTVGKENIDSYLKSFIKSQE